jgi:glycosyltransferase involved in cell wall biosynthesis
MDFMDISKAKVAWLVPSAIAGGYFGPLLAESSRFFGKSVFFTGKAWPGAEKTDLGTAEIKTVGKTELVRLQKNDGYGRNLIAASPAIVLELMRYRPDMVIANGFSIWTVFAILAKTVFKWQIVVILDGISTNTRFEDAQFRLWVRRYIAQGTDAFVANSQAAAHYLEAIIRVDADKIFQKTYIVPDPQALERNTAPLAEKYRALKILYTGQLVGRKGVRKLLEACLILSQKGVSDYTLMLVGDGDERAELESFVSASGLRDNVAFVGWLSYGDVGRYFRAADVFVLPTFEDTWGAVVLEAMAFGKPVLCSKMAGVSEVVVEGVTGFTFDPYDPADLADRLYALIDSPTLLQTMGDRAKDLAADYSPQDVAVFLAELSKSLLSSKTQVLKL